MAHPKPTGEPPKRRPSWLLLSTRATLLSLGTAVMAGLCVGLLQFFMAKPDLLQTARNNLRATTQIKAGNIVELQRQFQIKGHQVKHNEPMMAALAALLPGKEGSLAEARSMVERWSRYQLETGELEQVCLHLPGGQSVLHVSRDSKAEDCLEHTPSPPFKTALRTNEIRVTEMHLEEENRELLVDSYVPVGWDPATGRAAGVLILTADSTRPIRVIMQRNAMAWDTYRCGLLMETSGPLITLDRQAWGTAGEAVEAAPLRVLPLGEDSAGMISQLVAGETPLARFPEFHDGPGIHHLEPIPGTPWHLLSAVTKDEVLAPLVAESRNLGLMVGLAVLALAFGLFALSNRIRNAQAQEALERERSLRTTLTAISETEQRFKDAILHSPIPVMLVASDGEILDVSDSWTRMSSYARDTFTSLDAWLKEASRYEVQRRELVDYIHGEGNEDFHKARFEVRLGDGGEGIWILTCTRLGDLPDGRSLRMCIARDITIRESRERELQLVKTALEHSANAVIITDTEGIIVYSNQAVRDFTGYQPEELLGKSTSILNAQVQPDEFYTNLWQTIRSGHTWQGEFVNRRKDGSLYTEEAIITPVSLREGEITHFIAVKVDINERKKLEVQLYDALEKAMETSRLKTQFLATVSHEIRTPMNGIMGMTQMLLESGLNEEQAEMAEVVRHSGESLMVVIDDILNFSTMESGQFRMKEAVFDLKGMVQEVVAHARQKAANKGIAVESVFSENLPAAFFGDSSRIGQVLSNLLNNAIKFSEKGTVTVRCESLERPSGRHLKISVEDQGIGIPDEFRNKVFDSFSQAEADYNRTYGGLGLGLAITKRLVELMSGEIGFESQHGCGSTFWVILRYQPVPENLQGAVSHSHAGHQTPAKVSQILIADDDPDNCQVIRRMLEQLGHRVTTAANGQQAIEKLASGSYDLLLLDCHMPVLSGYETAQAIRHGMVEGIRRDIPIVAVTADVAEECRERTEAAGMNEFLCKPVRREELVEVVRRFQSNGESASGELSGG